MTAITPLERCSSVKSANSKPIKKQVVHEGDKPTYADVDKWFKDGNGFLNNLSEKEKELFLSKEENLPLGL